MTNQIQKFYVGCDVSDKTIAVCIIDNDGVIFKEGTTLTEVEDLISYLKSVNVEFSSIGLEAGGLSIWLCRALLAQGYPAVCIETHKASVFLSAQKMKTDRNDARGIAQMMRCGLYSAVHIKSDESQRLKMLINNRRFLVEQRVDIENQIRGTLKVFGYKIGAVRAGGYEARVRELVEGDGEIEAAIIPLLEQRCSGFRRILGLDQMFRTMAKKDDTCRLLMTAPGVGMLTAITYKAVIDDPSRFKRSKDVPAQLGLIPRKYASGTVDYNGGITKSGDAMLRSHLYKAAESLTRKQAKPCALKDWGRDLRKRSSYKGSTIAVARRLSIILHRMWMDQTEFNWEYCSAECNNKQSLRKKLQAA